MTEIWKDIEGWEGSYQVSDCGRVRSLDRMVESSNGRFRRFEGQVLRLQTNTNGYLYIGLHGAGRHVGAAVHRLVLQAFGGPAPEGHECNHKDGDKSNSRIENLEWSTKSDNQRHAYANGLASQKGEANNQAKLSPEIVEALRKVYALGQHTLDQVGLMFGVSGGNVGYIVRGDTWPDAGGPITC